MKCARGDCVSTGPVGLRCKQGGQFLTGVYATPANTCTGGAPSAVPPPRDKCYNPTNCVYVNSSRQWRWSSPNGQAVGSSCCDAYNKVQAAVKPLYRC